MNWKYLYCNPIGWTCLRWMETCHGMSTFVKRSRQRCRGWWEPGCWESMTLSLRLLVGWRIVQRLKRHAVTSTAEALQLRLKVLATRMQNLPHRNTR